MLFAFSVFFTLREVQEEKIGQSYPKVHRVSRLKSKQIKTNQTSDKITLIFFSGFVNFPVEVLRLPCLVLTTSVATRTLEIMATATREKVMLGLVSTNIFPVSKSCMFSATVPIPPRYSENNLNLNRFHICRCKCIIK